MNEIPDEIRKMFPNMPIHKVDIDDNGELHILASAEPFELDPHVEDWATEQVNAYLREHGYDPEQVGIRGKILTDALIENIKLKERAEAAEAKVAELEAARRWIPVSDGLPEKDGYYLGWSSTYGFEFVYFDTLFGGGRLSGVTHWMPLPEPPDA